MSFQRDMPIPLINFYHERQEAFINSLEKAIAGVANDDYIKQMFNCKLSTTFIPDRVCELIDRITSDEREIFLTSLLEKLNSLEICFGEKNLDRLEEVGNQLNDVLSIPMFDEQQYDKHLSSLLILLAELQTEIKSKMSNPNNIEKIENNTNKKIINKRNINFDNSSRINSNELHQISTFLNNMKNEVNDLQSQTIKMMKSTQKKIYQNLSKHNQFFEREELLKTIQNQAQQINQLTKKLQSQQQNNYIHPNDSINSINSLSSINSSNQISTEKYIKRYEKAKIIIQQLSQTNASLESNQHVLNEKIRQLKETNSKLKQNLTEISQNESSSYILNEQKSINEQDFLSLKEENEILKQRKENQKAKFQQRLHTLEVELQEMRESSLNLQSIQLEEKDKKIKELKEQNENLLSSIHAKSQHQQKLKEKIQQINHANEEQNSSIQTLTTDNSMLISTVKKTRRELRIQKQVNQEYIQQIEELKKTFSQAENDVKKAQEMISERLFDSTTIPLNEGLRKLFHLFDEEKEKRVEFEMENNRIKSNLAMIGKENSKSQQIIGKLTDQLKATTQFRTQYESQQSLLSESQSVIKQLQDETTKYKAKAKELYQSLTTITNERDELIEYKQFSDTLKKQNIELQKELKNSKTKLIKHEAEYQSITSTSQRQYAEQLKDLSKQLREANNRIHRIQTQSSKSFPIESFDDIPHIFSDLKQQLNKGNSTLSKVKSILQLKNDDDLIFEIKTMKQESLSLREFLKETSDNINAPNLKRCSKIISDMKSEIEYYKSNEQLICQILSLKDSSKIETKLKSTIGTNKIITKVLNALHIDDETQLNDRIAEFLSKETILLTNGLFTKEMIEEHFHKYNSLVIEKKEIIEKLKSNENLEESVQKLMNRCKELEEIASKLKITTSSPIKAEQYDEFSISAPIDHKPNRIETLLKCENYMKEICSILQVKDEQEIIPSISDLVNGNNDLIEEEEKIMTALAVMTPDSIIPKINDLSNQITLKTSILNNISEKLKVSDTSKLNEEIMNLISMKKEYKASKLLLTTDNLTESIRIRQEHLDNMQQLTNELCRILKVSEIDQIKPTLQYIMNENEEIHSIDLMFPAQYAGNLKDRVKKILQLIRDNHETNERLCKLLKITKPEEIERSINSMFNSQSMASELFSEMLKSMLAAEIEIIFPITNSEKNRLLSIFNDYKKRNDEYKLQVDLILNKAMGFGYRGSSCTEAVDVIVSAFSEADKHNISEKLHEELMTVRAATEKEKKTAEKQKAKSQRVISKLKQTISELQESGIKKESELVEKLEKEKQKVIELSSDLGNEQRIHRELIQLINGQVHDGKLLISSLSKKEASLIQEAENTMNTLTILSSNSSMTNRTVKFK
ncbi:hypothetical protein TRFO_26626 [Tritrichomonas foetus]|uniref:Uncharacterized protein n=1 Tax=Tritrichomonas foetus TaxID=1144522 RepID=A0A1J4K2E0_9EUKA|nr:hypothetical protein TRFO_26626 [Tritrichomonas foetus]|eukprot:OHT05559.1 hypothetical protein TRFO_26626 [Tritrichomonas foetus]